VAIAPVPSQGEIVRMYSVGELAHELARYHARASDNIDPFVDLCVELHNNGDINLLSVASQPAFAALGTQEFFTAQRFYCRAIPMLHTTAGPMMQCCRALIEKAGPDGAASRPKDAFFSWCGNNRAEADTVIRKARAGDALARGFLTVALQAEGHPDQAIDFVRTYDDDRRSAGMAALSAMSFADAAEAQTAISVLQLFVADADNDRIRMCALFAAFDILKKHHDAALADALINLAVRQPGPETLYGLAEILSRHYAMLDIATLRSLLRALEGVEREQGRTVQTIDMALSQFLGKDTEPLALNLLTTLIKDRGLTLENFESTAHELASDHPERQYELTVRWLLSGSHALCRSAGDLVSLHSKRHFDATAQPLGLSAEQQYFLCRKAIGWLFPYPVVCCSIIVSVLRAADPQLSERVSELLFDPMLVSYAGAAKDYLETILAPDTAYGAVRNVLAKATNFYVDIEGVGVIRELQPSNYQRDVHSQRSRDQAREFQKQAEAQSVFLSSGAVHRTFILYGKRSLTYVTGYDGTRQAVEMDLQTFSTTCELPTRDTLDPVGLHYMLRVFQLERMR
jgi:hypothetical protein